MPGSPNPRRIAVGLAATLALGGAIAGLSLKGIDARGLLGAVGARGSAAGVTIGAVANGSGVGGELVLDAARDGIRDAISATSGVGAAARGARVARRGHVFDANIVRVERGAGRVRVEASVVVSTLPGRSYQFASTSAITLTGSGADGDPGLTDATRRAMRSAAAHAVEQLRAR